MTGGLLVFLMHPTFVFVIGVYLIFYFALTLIVQFTMELICTTTAKIQHKISALTRLVKLEK